jgi:glycosyltransferase involved in cell wall biosynthesis
MPSCSDDETPLISFIIPFFNRFTLLRRAVESLTASAFQNFELFLIDDASTAAGLEGSLRALRVLKPDLVYHRQPKNEGQHNARLQGLARATGRWVFFMDSDDALFERESLPRMADFLLRVEAQGGAEIVLLCVAQWVTQDGEMRRHQQSVVAADKLTEREIWTTDAVLTCANSWLSQYGALWNYMYDRKFLLRDPVAPSAIRFGEDCMTANHYLFRSERTALFRNPFYLRFLDAEDRVCHQPQNTVKALRDGLSGLEKAQDFKAGLSPGKAGFHASQTAHYMRALLAQLDPGDMQKIPEYGWRELAAFIAPETLQGYGERHFNGGIFDVAINLFSYLLATEPKNPLPAVWLAFTAASQNNAEAAAEFIALVRQRAPADAELLIDMGNVFLQSGHASLARDCFASAAAIEARDATRQTADERPLKYPS